VPLIRDWLAANADQRARDIADQLRPYAEGRLASWFDGTGRKVDMKSHFTVVEMDDLKGQGMFRNIVLTMVMQRIAETMYGLGDPNIPKLMMIDEAWDLLGSLQTGDFIERAYRTYRKYGGSAGVITQGFNDFKKSNAAMAAYANSSWLFALAQKPESLEMAFKEGMVYSEDEGLKSLIKSVHTYPGKYSEIFVRGEQGQGVYRFIADPYAYWLFTTSPGDKAQRTKKITEVKNKNPDWSHGKALSEAVRMLASETTKRRYGKTPADALSGITDYVPRGI
jgi:conjugal transfer ATP-binding protein TraC